MGINDPVGIYTQSLRLVADASESQRSGLTSSQLSDLIGFISLRRSGVLSLRVKMWERPNSAGLYFEGRGKSPVHVA